MLITLSGLADETTLHLTQRSFLSKVKGKAVFVCLNGLPVCQRFWAKKLGKLVIFTYFVDVCNFEKLQKDVLWSWFCFNEQYIWHESAGYNSS